MPESRSQPSVTLLQAAAPILFLIGLITYGLVLRPLAFGDAALPLEMVFVTAAVFAVALMRRLGFAWDEIQEAIVAKLTRALPAIFILFAIGVIISSWMVSGTIPMLVYYGIRIINPTYLYLLAFVVPVIFSSLTGTSWGSAGTIGVVIIGIAASIGADLGITAGAIIGGAYFGDKMSPLSDTTNLAALGADVELFDHIRSMMNTTVPSAAIASVAYLVLGHLYAPAGGRIDTPEVHAFLEGLSAMFTFHPLLLLPPVVVLIGSMRRYPTVPVLMVSIVVAATLAFVFQPFSLGEVMQSLNRGFNADMAPWAGAVPPAVLSLVNRGGLYSMAEAIFAAFLIFVFIGAIDPMKSMERVVDRAFRFARSRPSTILSALAATALTNAMTSNQYATSFIVGDAFRSRFDRMRIPRKVLSRSLEDTGTMLESIVPWHATAVFMVATLGVPVAEYWHWQLLSLTNFIVAPLLAVTGIGCFYHEVRDDNG